MKLSPAVAAFAFTATSLLGISLLTTSAGAAPRAGGGRAAALAADRIITAVGENAQVSKKLSDYTGAKATVLLFVGTECPISNSYAPEIAALARSAKSRGANVVLVYSNAGTTAEAVRKHRQSYRLTGLPAVLDSDQKLADAVGATCTPEAFVLDAGRKVCYQGRIDDRFFTRGTTGKATGATTHELRDALNSVIAGKSVKVASATATGCSIERLKVATVTGPTYARDIAPILNANCVSCHRAGEIGPMTLTSYADVKRWADNIATVTDEKKMPPWKPVAGCGPFVGERTLNADQIATLKKWADAGAPEGNSKDLPPAPKFTTGWRLGEPDLILTMPTKWKVPAGSADDYRCFVLPTGLTEDKEVVAVEYRAGNKRVVHHCLGYIDTAGQGRAREGKDGQPGYTSFGGPGFTPVGEMGGWAPGNFPAFLPDGIARPLPAGSDLVLQVHYHADGKDEEDQTSVGLYFARKPIKQNLRIIPIVAPLRIPAGEANFETMKTFTSPIDAKLISVTPHMHLLGRKIAMDATLPDGTVKSLIKIDNWDFNWQDTYTFKEPIDLPKGTVVKLTASYDNSSANPRNPNNPPKPVTWGEATTDEMCIGFLSFVPANENDPMVKMMDVLKSKPGAIRKVISAQAQPAAN